MLSYYYEKENESSVKKVLDFNNFDNLVIENDVFVEQLYKMEFRGKVYCIVKPI